MYRPNCTWPASREGDSVQLPFMSAAEVAADEFQAHSTIAAAAASFLHGGYL
jgi:hypothetical protein